MGGVFGHMSHIYDNPGMSFGQIKDIMEKASAGKLENVTEKTDGQNLFVSYNVKDGTVRAARNKGNLKDGGLTTGELATKFAGRGALTDAFVGAFAAFEEAVESFSEEEKIELFGDEANIFYNAEVMDPGNPNVINYDTKTFLIHRAGHAEFDRETGKPIDLDKGFSERQAAKLENALLKAQDETAEDQFGVQVNAIKNLSALTDNIALNTALGRLGKVMSAAGMGDEDTISDYIFAKWHRLVSARLPDLTDREKGLIIDRVMTDYYGALEGAGPLKSRGLESRQITKTIGKPELDKEIVTLIKSYPEHFKKFVFPIEDVIHRFSVEIMRAVESSYIIATGANQKELNRLRNLVSKGITQAEASESNREERMEIIKSQLEKLKKLEDDGSIGELDLDMISSPAEGIVFDYEGHTYKFTGGFAPMNQILGLFTYGRKGIPALDMTENQYRAGATVKKNIALYPGKFKPPHGGHFSVAKQVIANPEVDKLIIWVSPKEHENITAEQAAAVWDYYSNYLPGDVEIRVANVTPVQSVYEYIDEEAEIGDDLHLVLGEKDIEGGRFKSTEGRREGVGINVVPIPPQMGGVSGTEMRASLQNDLNSFKKGLPIELNDSDIQDIITILGGRLEEVSAMGAGSVGIAAVGSKGGPWNSTVVRKANKKEKEVSTLRGAKEFISEEEEIVNEVVDYLLGITVG